MVLAAVAPTKRGGLGKSAASGSKDYGLSPGGAGDAPGCGSDGGAGTPGDGVVKPCADQSALQFIKQRLKAEHFLQLLDPEVVYMMKTTRTLPTLAAKLQPMLKCSVGLMAQLQGCDLDWDVIQERVRLPELKLDDDDDGVAALFGKDVGDGVACPLAAPLSTPSPSASTDLTFQGWLFFRFTLKSPARVGQKVNTGQKQPFEHSDIAVQLVKVHRRNIPDHSLFVSDCVSNVQGDDVDHRIMSGHIADYKTIHAGIDAIRFLHTDKKVHYMCELPALRHLDTLAVSRTLGALHKCNALESCLGGAGTFVIEKADTCHTPILVALEEEGVVLRSYEGGLTTGWRITEAGEGLVSFGSCLRGPQLVHWPRKDVDPKNQTTWELVDTLHSRGWHAQVWHEAAADPDHVVVNKGGPKIFYIKPHYVTLQRAYLESLVRLSEVKEKYVRHFRKPKYYIDLFKATKSVMEADKGGHLTP